MNLQDHTTALHRAISVLSDTDYESNLGSLRVGIYQARSLISPVLEEMDAALEEGDGTIFVTVSKVESKVKRRLLILVSLLPMAIANVLLSLRSLIVNQVGLVRTARRYW